MIEKIGIIGGGSWGTALALTLIKNQHDVDMWIRNEKDIENIKENNEHKRYLPGVKIPKSLNVSKDLSEIIHNKKILILAVPSHAIRNTLLNIKNEISKDQIIVNVAKGIENDTLYRISEIVNEILPRNEYSVLSGPSHAEEVAKEVPTAVIIASKKRKIAEFLQEVFMSPTFRVYTNPDVIGVELGGALKNVVALGAGISDGLGYGDNTKAALMNRGIAEISRLGVKLGSNKATFAGLSGIGDLIVTCTSMHSRNRRAGIMIGKGYSMDEAVKSVGMVVEGIKTTKSAYELSRKYNIEMPITEEIYEVLYNNKDVKNSVMNLMLRNRTDEIKDLYEDDIL